MTRNGERRKDSNTDYKQESHCPLLPRDRIRFCRRVVAKDPIHCTTPLPKVIQIDRAEEILLVTRAP